MNYADYSFGCLRGKTIERVEGLCEGSDEVHFYLTSGEHVMLKHWQDCCEDVRLVDVFGDVDDLVGHPLLLADVSTEDMGDRAPWWYSATWTFYRLATIKGYVTFRWVGESNGYYSEEVSCDLVLEET